MSSKLLDTITSFLFLISSLLLGLLFLYYPFIGSQTNIEAALAWIRTMGIVTILSVGIALYVMWIAIITLLKKNLYEYFYVGVILALGALILGAILIFAGSIIIYAMGHRELLELFDTIEYNLLFMILSLGITTPIPLKILSARKK
ncbi:MAG: hypothetical protein Q6363_001950 [Candidatus Njordarchaeota archaeon]